VMHSEKKNGSVNEVGIAACLIFICNIIDYHLI
jgi:hypothetical protein